MGKTASTAIDLFGSFPGSGFSLLHCERLMLTEVAPRRLKAGEDPAKVRARRPITDKMIAVDWPLMRRKWFDYRGFHPTIATMLFAECYNQAISWAFTRYIDMKRGPHVRGIRGANPFISATLAAGLWKARQTADEMRVPYDFWCRRAIEWCMDRGWTRLPQPNQLYSEEVVASAVGAWDDYTKARLIWARDDRYLLSNYADTPDQNDHQEWLVTQLRRRPRPEYGIGEVCIKRPMLSLDRAEREWGASIVAEARFVCR